MGGFFKGVRALLIVISLGTLFSLEGGASASGLPRVVNADDLLPSVVVGAEDRTPSNDPSVGRLRKERIGSYNFCTATLVSRGCVITAGHCAIVFGVLEFDLEVVPNQFRYAKPENLFVVDRKREVKSDNGKGDDWAVLPVLRNKKTGKYPGDDRPIVPLAKLAPVAEESVYVTGYGAAENLFSFSQQSSKGRISQLHTDGPVGPYFEHDVDTGNGSSGSAVRNATTGEILGIHTHGDTDRFVNSGTVVPGNAVLIKALAECDAGLP
jgi:V8-like Glu-specific endopeptidase